MRTTAALAAALAILAAARAASAQSGPLPPPSISPLPPAAQAVDVEEHLGLPLPEGMVFTDSDGKRVAFDDLFRDGKPVVVVLTYFHCPMLCGLVLEGAVKAMNGLDWKLGPEYRAVTVSFDPRDHAQAATRKRDATHLALRQKDVTPHWPFLVGDEENIKKLTGALGFAYAWDEATQQYAHPAVIVVITPDRRISRYLYGIDYEPRDLRLALNEAGDGRVGSIVDRVILSCFRYDPASRRYGVYVYGVLRIASLAMVVGVAIVLAFLWRRDKRRQSEGNLP
jgi:protein SCO1/2